MKARIALIAVAVCISPILSQARWMNPNTGRFQTMDTYEGNKREPQSLHKYTYAHNNPVNNTDPSGNEIVSTLVSLNISSTLGSHITPVSSSKWSVYKVPWGASRYLTQNEINLGQTIFGNNINFQLTGVNYGKWAFWQPTGREMTPDGIIHTGGQTISDYTIAGSKPNWSYGLLGQQGILIHELCHVWQKQQGVKVVMRGLYRNYNYAGPNFGKLAFESYGIEQQAQMTEDYFYLRNGSVSSTTPTPTPSLTTYERLLPFLPGK